MNKKIALCYDFDGTLCFGYMQNQKLIPDCKIKTNAFWSEVIQFSHDNKTDPTPAKRCRLDDTTGRGHDPR